MIGVATDVTERKLAEEALDRSSIAELAALAEVDEAQRRLAFYAGAREERKMISRELHDRVAHSMAVVRQCLELYEAFRDRDPPAAAAKLEQAKEEAKSALGATRYLSMMLRRSEAEGGSKRRSRICWRPRSRRTCATRSPWRATRRSSRPTWATSFS